MNDVKDFDWPALVTGATSLTILEKTSSSGSFADVLEAVDCLPSIKLFFCGDELFSGAMFGLGQIEEKLSKRGGRVIFREFHRLDGTNLTASMAELKVVSQRFY